MENSLKSGTLDSGLFLFYVTLTLNLVSLKEAEATYFFLKEEILCTSSKF